MDEYHAAYHADPSTSYVFNPDGNEITFVIERQPDSQWLVRHDKTMDPRIFDRSWERFTDSIENACVLIECVTDDYLEERAHSPSSLSNKDKKEVQSLREKYPPKSFWNKIGFRLGLAKISLRILVHGST